MKRVITSLLAILFVLPMVFPLAACTTETGGENMANYLYNGVELPELPQYDESAYPYAFIEYYGDLSAEGLPGVLSYFIAWSAWQQNGSFSVPTPCKNIVYTYASDAETAAGLGIESGVWVHTNTNEFSDSGNVSFPDTGILWTNTDILNPDGSVYLAASTPVPVGGSKLTISTGGSANGDGMALYNGVILPNIESVWDKETYPYAYIEVADYSAYGVDACVYGVTFADRVVIYDDEKFKLPGLVHYSTFSCVMTQEDLDTFAAAGISLPSYGNWIEDVVGGEITEGSWVGVNDGEPSVLHWINHNVISTADNSVKFAASDPIPLDGMNVITWDGDTTGLESVESTWFKVSDEVVDKETAQSGIVLGSDNTISDTGTHFDLGVNVLALEGGTVLLVSSDGASMQDLTIAHKGIYFVKVEGAVYTSLFAYPATSGGVTETTATVNFSCKDLLYTDSVYRIKAWVYEPGAGGSGTMLYNGVELPELPEWDKDTYPYAFIEIQKDFIYLHCLKTKFHYCYSEHYACYAMLPYYGDSFAYFNFYRELDSETGTWTDGWKTGSAVDYGTGSYGFPERWSEKLCVWANYDVLNCYHVAEDPECDCPIYLAASEPVPAGLDVTQPATWTSDLFAGPSHSESHTFTGLTPATDYAVYGVIYVTTDEAASEHNATATFTTLEGEAPTGTIQFGAVNITGTGFTAVIEASGLDDATAYTAEIVVYNTATSAVAAEAVRSFTGNYTMAIDFAGLTPETDYTVAVDVYPTDTGKVVARGEFPVATGQEEPKTSWRDSFLLGFASGLGCTAATKTDADHNAWMQGYIVGDELRSAITTKQGFQYEVPDLQATVRMVAECFTESGDTLLFNAHNGSMILGVSTPNEATFTDRTDVTKYLIPIPAEASKVTVETTDTQVTMAQFVGVNGSGGNYTKVFSSAREAVYSYEFEKGAAQYMAIDLIYEDKGAVTVPWDYDAAATTTVTFT